MSLIRFAFEGSHYAEKHNKGNAYYYLNNDVKQVFQSRLAILRHCKTNNINVQVLEFTENHTPQYVDIDLNKEIERALKC